MILIDGELDTALSPTHFLEDYKSDESDIVQSALIILNSPIQQYGCFRRLYEHALYRLCADGGANRLCDLLTSQFIDLPWLEALQKALPDCIHGDLDSLDDAVRTRYEQLGVEISKDDDQYCPDFAKAMKKVSENLPKVSNVLVLGSLGGRVDHGVGLLSEMYSEHKRHPRVIFWLFSESSVSVILKPGTTSVKTPLSSGLITRNIGILPVYGPAVISTKGLEWDVEDWPTKMGGQVSTSNHIMEDIVRVKTDVDILLTIERAVQ